MILINMASPLILFLMLLATVLLIFLAQELKKSYIAIGPLLAYLAILVLHVVELITAQSDATDIIQTLYRCLAIDFVFIFITFFSYLWIDDMEAKKLGKKSIDNSLDWFWKNV